MYTTTTSRTTLGSALPRQVTPPSWLRNIAGAVLRGTQVTVPTAAGPQTFNLNDPNGSAQLKALANQAIAALRSAASGATISVTRKPGGASGAVDSVNKAVTENVPGGWVTVLGLIVGVPLAIKMLSGRK